MRTVGHAKTIGSVRTLVLATAVLGISVVVGWAGCALFQSDLEARGQGLYEHYCMHCHGASGRQNEGYNWITMPDPRPKDLASESEMSTFKDEEIFETIYRDMKDTTPEVGEPIGDEEFAVPTMPTFKYTLSEEEIWAVVAYVRTLHGMSLTFDVEGRMKELADRVAEAQRILVDAEQALEAAEAKAEAAAEQLGEEVDEEAYLEEEETADAAAIELDQAEVALARFSSRPKYASIPRPNLNTSRREASQLAALGKRLYMNKYGCNACHALEGTGGKVGPALDRAGFRLNSTWVYRWIKYPQSIKPKTRMPNLGINDADAKALTLYLKTLRAPKPEKPVIEVAG